MSGPGATRLGALLAGQAAAPGAIVPLLGSGDEQTRRLAVTGMPRLPAGAEREALVGQALADRSAMVRVEALRAAARIYGQATCPALETLAADSELVVRLEAIDLLIGCSRDSTVARLLAQAARPGATPVLAHRGARAGEPRAGRSRAGPRAAGRSSHGVGVAVADVSRPRRGAGAGHPHAAPLRRRLRGERAGGGDPGADHAGRACLRQRLPGRARVDRLPADPRRRRGAGGEPRPGGGGGRAALQPRPGYAGATGDFARRAPRLAHPGARAGSAAEHAEDSPLPPGLRSGRGGIGRGDAQRMDRPALSRRAARLPDPPGSRLAEVEALRGKRFHFTLATGASSRWSSTPTRRR